MYFVAVSQSFGPILAHFRWLCSAREKQDHHGDSVTTGQQRNSRELPVTPYKESSSLGFRRITASQAGKSAFQAAKRDERPLSFDPGRRGFDPRLPLFNISNLESSLHGSTQ